MWKKPVAQKIESKLTFGRLYTSFKRCKIERYQKIFYLDFFSGSTFYIPFKWTLWNKDLQFNHRTSRNFLVGFHRRKNMTAKSTFTKRQKPGKSRYDSINKTNINSLLVESQPRIMNKIRSNCRVSSSTVYQRLFYYSFWPGMYGAIS